MSLPERPVKVAAIQHAPCFLDLDRSLDRAAELTARAAGLGAEMVVFPETWLPGYPVWLDLAPNAGLWDHPPAKAVFARLFDNSVDVPGPATERLAATARAHGVVLVVGANERAGGTLYNSILYFGPDGALLGTHRKLVPTYTERLVWGRGDGHSLRAVETPCGTLGGLVCWEHWMPLSRQAMHDQNEFVHTALWPTVKDTSLLASRHYAFEGRCFVIAAGTVLRRRDLPDLEMFAEIPAAPDDLLMAGGSAIIDPSGEVIAGPLGTDEDLLLAEIDPRHRVEGLLTLDTAGHYARPDLFHFEVKR